MNKEVALVTGASGGIGKAIVEKFETLGYSVLQPDLEELNLLSEASVDRYLKKIAVPIDILINNAGINQIEDIFTLTDKNIHETLAVNLIEPLRLIRGIVPGMKDRTYGRIVNISSIWSMVSKPGRVAYSVSKSGLNAITRTLAIELAKYNILVNSVAPGFVNTELTRKNNTIDEIKKIEEKIPMGRLAEVEEIAEVVVFLTSRKNSYITGQTIVVDGGYVCQ